MTRAWVHPTAVVDPGAKLGDAVKVWHYTHVSDGAWIGAGSSLGQNVFVGRRVPVGARVKVQNNVSLYEGVVVEDDVFLGPSVVFTNVRTPRAFVDRHAEFEATRVRRGASLGANATVRCGVTIGEYALVGAGAVVVEDVPAHAIVVGNPAVVVGYACRCGARALATTAPPTPTSPPRCAACTTLAREAPARIPLHDVAAENQALLPDFAAALARVVGRGQFVLGPEVEAFEREAAAYLGVDHAVGVSSGTDAVLVALMALGVGPGDEVVVPSFSFVASASAAARLGARAVFVDLEPDGFNLDPEAVRAALGPKSKAVVVAHLFGRPAAIAEIARVAETRGVAVVEDAAQAFGATVAGRRVGGFGRAGCFSFFPTKNLGGLGDGGLVATNDAAFAAQVRRLRIHGATGKYRHEFLGGNFRLDELQAAFLRAKLPHVDAWNDARRHAARDLDARLRAAGLDARLRLPDVRDPGQVFSQFVVRTANRDALAQRLEAAGIATAVHYPSILPDQPALAAARADGGPDAWPRASAAANEVLALPLAFGDAGAESRRRIVEAIGG